MKTNPFDENGYLKVRRNEGAKPKSKHYSKSEKQELEIQICQTCKKEKCTGSASCVRRQMELRKEKNE